ncbi:COX15/CtaA family protein [Pseudonocardia xishanensis]|uniref:COX15/CtaA family protein n=1 Tax=Pseudonocardia xishanensis TaxID=630995 RepID=A0ABP8RFV9_9PSEU
MWNRIPATSPLWMRRLAILSLVGQAGIMVTGAVVRVTGSGLGCPTWPDCFPGSLVPEPHPEIAALTQWVEFGNRLLAVFLTIVAAATFLAALNTRPRRPRLTRLALAMPLGVVAQAVIGGFTVLAGLAWWSVMPHFLASTILVWLAVELVDEATAGGPVTRTVPRAVRGLAVVSAAVLAGLLTAGTLVTAAGPHAGDAATPRLDVPVTTLAQVHADLLFAYLGLTAGLGFALWAVGAPRRLKRRFGVLVIVVLAQGALGGIQYSLGVPEVLVALHVLGAALTTAAAASVRAGTTHRSPAPLPTPTPQTEQHPPVRA